MDDQEPMDDTPKPPRPVSCNCGTRLVADALFCHRCGKPVFELPEPENPPAMAFPSSAAGSAVTPPPPAESGAHPAVSGYQGPPEPIDLRNKLAVQLAFFVAVFEFPMIAFSGLFPVNPLVMSAMVLALGGFFAVYLYQKRTRCKMGVLNGFRLGWISGLLLFLLVLVFGALQFAFFTFSGGSLMAQMEQVMAVSGANGMPPEQQQIMREVFSDGSKLFVMMLVALFLLFLFLTACAGVGGAMGARSRITEPRSH